jgi:hypothetical protein
MDGRTSEAGPLKPVRAATVTIPNITDGDHADVALAADAAFKDPSGTVARAIGAYFKGAPLANLVILGAWVSTITTGVVTVRFGALSGNVTTDDQDIVVKQED